MPDDLRIIIAMYGSTFNITWTESCSRCDALGDKHIINNILVRFEDIQPAINMNIPSVYLLTCPITDKQVKKRYPAIDMLSDKTWHARCVSPRKCSYLPARWKTLSNPSGEKQFKGVIGLPRDAYVFDDNGVIKNSFEECNNPCVVQYHSALITHGELTFRPDVF